MEVSKNAFSFCKITITILVWLAYIFKIKELILLTFIILLFSAILKIKRAPMIFLYSNTIDKIFKSKKISLDEKGMRFAHTTGSIFSGICVILLYLNLKAAWPVVLIFAVIKTISALGFCPGEKLYSCMKGGCCSLTKK
jgi:hypothetical protein